MLQITSAFFEKGRGNQSQLNNGVFGETTLAADQGNLKMYLVMLRCLGTTITSGLAYITSAFFEKGRGNIM